MPDLRGWLGRFRGSAFSRYFAAFFALASLVLILSSVLLYRQFEIATTEAVARQTVERLAQARNTFHAVHDWIIAASVQLSTDPSIGRLLYGGPLDLTEAASALSRLQELTAYYPLIASVYLFNEAREEFYSSVNGREGSQCSDPGLPLLLREIGPQDLFTYIPRRSPAAREIPPPGGERDAAGCSVFTLVFRDQGLRAPSGNRSSLVVNIRESDFRRAFLTQFSTAGGDIIVLDQGGRIISHPRPDLVGDGRAIADIHAEIAARAADAGEVGTRNARTLVSYVRDGRFGWVFVHVVSRERLFAPVAAVRNAALVIFGVLFGLSLLLAFVTSRGLYRPIGRLVASASRMEESLHLAEAVPEPKADIDEINRLGRVFSSLAAQVRSARDERTRETLRRYLLGLSTQPPEALEHHDPDHGLLLLVVVRIDGYRRHVAEIGLRAVAELYASLERFLADQLAVDAACTVVDEEYLILTLPLGPGDPEAAARALLDRLAVARRAAEERLRSSFSAAAVGPLLEKDALPDAYRTAVATLESAFVRGPGSILRAAPLPMARGGFRFPEGSARSVIEEIRKRDPRKALEHTRAFMSVLESGTREGFRLSLLLLRAMIARELEEIRLPDDAQGGSPAEALRRLDETDTLAEAREALEGIVRRLASSPVGIDRADQRRLVARTKELIAKSLSDRALCPDWVAGKMGYSTSHIRFLFKKNEGLSLSDYITEARLLAARELLKDSSLSVRQAAERAGFYNYTYFFTVFKRRFGRTPADRRIAPG